MARRYITSAPPPSPSTKVVTYFVFHYFYGTPPPTPSRSQFFVESNWNVMAHGDAPGGEVEGKLANGVGSQYSSHYLGTWCIQHYYRWCAHLGWQQSTELTAPADLNGLVLFAERRNLVSARVPSHFNWSLRVGWVEVCSPRKKTANFNGLYSCTSFLWPETEYTAWYI